MRAVVCRGFDDPAQTVVEPAEAPALGADEVRIQVFSSGVGFANLLVLAGKHQNRVDPPFVPGTEVAGVVIEVGPKARLFKPGDRVAAGMRRGGYADEVVVPQRTVFAIPDSASFDDAVQFPVLYGTAYSAFRWRARLQPGETLLVHGAAGGSGMAAVEIGKVLGARVIATAGSPEKLAVAREHGADEAINYRDGGFRERVLELTGGRGADVMYDPVGGAVFAESLRCMAPEGRLVTIGYAGGEIPQVPANILLVKNLDVIGLYWGYYLGWGRFEPPEGTDDKVRAAFAEMFGWLQAGKLAPATHAAFPLEDFRAALEMVARRQVVGRIALHPQG